MSRTSSWKVGQRVVVLRVGNAARGRSGDELIFDDEVEWVGNKLFTLEAQVGKFHKDTGVESVRGVTPDYVVYPSREAIEEARETGRKWDTVRTFFNRQYSIPDWLTGDDLDTLFGD